MPDDAHATPVGLSTRYRVLLADDHAMLLDMLQRLLEPEFEVVGTVGDGECLLEAAPRLQPDIALIDVNMPRLDGLEAGQRLRTLMPEIKLIFLTMETDPALAVEAFGNGASGYLLKTGSAEELLRAVRIVATGDCYLTPAIANGDIDALCRMPATNPLGRLSEREIEVLRLLVTGLSMKAAARQLGITPRTIAFHKYRAMTVLGLRGNPDLIQLALRHGWLSQVEAGSRERSALVSHLS